MEAVKQIVDSSVLNGIISLPQIFQNKKVEIMISLVESELPQFTDEELNTLMEGSITQSLIGALKDSNISINEYRDERLRKYEIAD